MPEAADAAAAEAAEAAAEAAAAEEAAEEAAAAVAAEAADAACRGEFAVSARLEHVAITLTDADRHGRVDEVRPGQSCVVCSAA